MESEIGADEPVCVAVVRAVSAVVGLEPRSLQPLSDVLDPEALDALFAPRPNGVPRPGGCLSFVYSGCRVSVDNGEYLTVHLLDDHAELASPLGIDRRAPTGRGSKGDDRR